MVHPVITSEGDEVFVTEHCAFRYHERVCLDAHITAARGDLRRRISEEGIIQLARPDWLPPIQTGSRTRYQDLHTNIGYLLLGDDLALPLTETTSGQLVARTVLRRGFTR